MATVGEKSESTAPEPIWAPSAEQLAGAQLTVFARGAAADAGYDGDPESYDSLWEWSTDSPAQFWRAVWEHFELADRRGDRLADGDEAVLSGSEMPGAVWFPDVELNYVDRVLAQAEARPSEVAVVGRTETGDRTELTWAQLAEQTREFAAYLREVGVSRGDRVAAYLPDLPETVVAFLGTAFLGAIWAGCGQDYAAQAAAGRLAQLEPTVLVTADGYRNAGKWLDKTGDVAELVSLLPSLRRTVGITRAEGAQLPPHDAWADALARGAELRGAAPDAPGATPDAPGATPDAPGATLDAPGDEPVAVPFDHPLWVLFSSGTTGTPKGIVHGHGGVLLEHLKATGLHGDLGPDDVFFWYTSLSWMMWNYQIAGLLAGSRILCFDGSPVQPDADALWGLVADEKVTYFGTSPGQILASRKAELHPGRDHDLSALRVLGSTGSPLPADSFRWIHDRVGEKVQVASISGGTDVVSAFVGGTSTVPVVPGELSARYLGCALEAWRPDGTPVTGEVGEMVIRRPMPSMPVMFWNDPEGERYRGAYFDHFPGVWRHGDWVLVTSRGSVEIHGRSDATLNRHGIRMGSADIYAVVEAIDGITEAFVLGVDGPDGAYWMPLFVTLAEGRELDDDLVDAVRSRIRAELSPRHVPDEVRHAPGIPHTRTGKKLEVPVTALLAGRDDVAVDPQSIDRPDLLEWYREQGADHAW